MYNFPYFKESDNSVINEFIAKHPFAFLTGADVGGKTVATQIPVFLETEGERIFLRGHIMKNTDHHKAFVVNPQVLVVFTGPHTYVSATWYTNPQQGSTWNYMSVHVRGKIIFGDGDALISVLRKTSLHFENYNEAAMTTFDNLPVEYRERLMKAIVPFEIEIEQMENVFKLSQNRDPESYDNIIEKLKAQGGDGALIAQEMEKRKEEVFPEGTEWKADRFFA
jgi:transcriptional regulator